MCQGGIAESRCRVLPYWWAGLSALTHDKAAIITCLDTAGVFLEQTMKNEVVIKRLRAFSFSRRLSVALPTGYLKILYPP